MNIQAWSAVAVRRAGVAESVGNTIAIASRALQASIGAHRSSAFLVSGACRIGACCALTTPASRWP